MFDTSVALHAVEKHSLLTLFFCCFLLCFSYISVVKKKILLCASFYYFICFFNYTWIMFAHCHKPIFYSQLGECYVICTLEMKFTMAPKPNKHQDSQS